MSQKKTKTKMKKNKQYKFWIDVPIWEYVVESVCVIAGSEKEALEKYKEGPYEYDEYSEVIDSKRGTPQIVEVEEINDSRRD